MLKRWIPSIKIDQKHLNSILNQVWNFLSFLLIWHLFMFNLISGSSTSSPSFLPFFHFDFGEEICFPFNFQLFLSWLTHAQNTEKKISEKTLRASFLWNEILIRNAASISYPTMSNFCRYYLYLSILFSECIKVKYFGVFLSMKKVN